MNIDKKVDLTNNGEKIVAGVGVGLVLLVLNAMLPWMIEFASNLWKALILIVPALLLIVNYQSVWSLFKLASFKLRRMILQVDPLGHMYLYHAHIMDRITNLEGSITNMIAARTKLARTITTINNQYTAALSASDKYERRNNETPGSIDELEIRSERTKVKIYKDQLDKLKPHFETMVKQLEYLTELKRLWSADASELLMTLDAKKIEYESFKEMAEAAGNAAEFLKGNTEQYKSYQESIKLLEQTVSEHSATLEKFDKDAQPILKRALLGESMNAEDGKLLVEEYQKQRLVLNADTTK